METKLIKKTIVLSVLLLLTTTNVCTQQMNRELYTIVPIDSIYIESRVNRLALNSITTNNIQSLFGKPINIKIYNEEWSDEYDKQAIYEYELLTIYFKSLKNKEWMDYIECLNPATAVIINGIRLSVGIGDSILNVFEESWAIYQELENTKGYQNKVKQGHYEKILIIEFPIKKGNYEYFGSILISVKDESIEKIELYLQDEV